MRVFLPLKILYKVPLFQLSLSFALNPYPVKDLELNLEWIPDLIQISSIFFGSLALITPAPIAITIFLNIIVSTKRDSIKTSLIFCNISSSTWFDLHFFLANERKSFLLTFLSMHLLLLFLENMSHCFPSDRVWMLRFYSTDVKIGWKRLACVSNFTLTSFFHSTRWMVSARSNGLLEREHLNKTSFQVFVL